MSRTIDAPPPLEVPITACTNGSSLVQEQAGKQLALEEDAARDDAFGMSMSLRTETTPPPLTAFDKSKFPDGGVPSPDHVAVFPLGRVASQCGGRCKSLHVLSQTWCQPEIGVPGPELL